jgi:hypothetical protein
LTVDKVPFNQNRLAFGHKYLRRWASSSILYLMLSFCRQAYVEKELNILSQERVLFDNLPFSAQSGQGKGCTRKAKKVISLKKLPDL